MSQENILIVEDETITALDIRQSLIRSGYNVVGVAISGPEAIVLAAQTAPDLILMDIRLKGEMDGIEAAVEIRTKANTPVIFLTAYADRSTLQRAKEAEPFAYLLKPFEEAVLATTIEIALHKHRAQEYLVQQNLEARRLSEVRFDRLVQSIPDYAVILMDAAGTIISWSPGAERLYGWCAAEALGKPFAMLYAEEDIAGHRPEADLEQATRQWRQSDYLFQAHRSTTRFSAQVGLICLRDGGGKIAGFLRVAREVIGNGGHN